MTEPTDKTIAIQCQECEALCEGIPEMVFHLLDVHGEDYSVKEATNVARVWADDAYEREELWHWKQTRMNQGFRP